MIPRVWYLSGDGCAKSFVRHSVPSLCFAAEFEECPRKSVSTCDPAEVVICSHRIADRVRESVLRGYKILELRCDCAALDMSSSTSGVACRTPALCGGTVLREIESLFPQLRAMQACVDEYSAAIGLAPAERRAVSLLLAGHSVDEAARRVLLSPRTLEGQLACVRRKAGNKTVSAILSEFAWRVAAKSIACDRLVACECSGRTAHTM